MGISVPISVEHYKTLKMISDKLGIGLKKTVEYLVTYYSEREMLPTESPETEIKPIKEMIESEKEITLTRTASIMTQIPPMMERIYGLTNSASKDKDNRQLQEKQVISVPETTVPSPSMIERIYGWTNSASKDKDNRQLQEKQVISVPETTTPRPTPWAASNPLTRDQNINLPESKTNRENCSACGMPKRENSKYCYNCGNLIQL